MKRQKGFKDEKVLNKNHNHDNKNLIVFSDPKTKIQTYYSLPAIHSIKRINTLKESHNDKLSLEFHDSFSINRRKRFKLFFILPL
ncbi:hypothetical protein EAE89_18225 [Photorhabdus heterorhabditis]|uniref:Uncharacterized protein n=1 Tax=Photorhabdus heterorhabditis TaxID=880156 RepID=A0ABR5KBZ1_9GAMM|nr:hypothetical protein AM629_11385 [Photorhabdus heterorhabditis]MBS9443548.1 hypothetical protein [Photorhabdus heterorhabditis]